MSCGNASRLSMIQPTSQETKHQLLFRIQVEALALHGFQLYSKFAMPGHLLYQVSEVQRIATDQKAKESMLPESMTSSKDTVRSFFRSGLLHTLISPISGSDKSSAPPRRSVLVEKDSSLSSATVMPNNFATSFNVPSVLSVNVKVPQLDNHQSNCKQ